MSDLILSLSGVTIRYPDQQAFTDINFTVRKGEHWLVTGENEVLRNVLPEAIAGKVSIINGSSEYPFFKTFKQQYGINDPVLSPQKLMGFISSRHPFRDLSNTANFYYQQRFNSSDSEHVITVRQYLGSIASHQIVPGWTENMVISKLRLESLMDEQLIKLSNGESKRLQIAAALLKGPSILLMINPLAGIDVTSRIEISQLINEIAETGITIIMTGNVREMPEVITHIAVAGHDNRLHLYKKDDYSPEANQGNPEKTVDETDIKRLIPVNEPEQYQHIVLMNNVSIRYGEKTILKNINWRIRQGERWALTGPNGSGKSTLLSLITGDNPQAFANNIILFDRKKGSGESIWDIKRKIGFFSPELYQYFPLETSCLQAVISGFYDTIGLFRRPSDQQSESALRWMKLLGVDHLSNKLLKHVSISGQRLCLLARAFVKSPVLLILDEPCQGFDENNQQKIKTIVNTICANSNTTLIYVTHYSEEIPDCVDNSFILNDGKQAEFA